LSYGREETIESYYNFPIPIGRGIYGALDLQYINNPGYNRDRGPVIVPGLRLHLAGCGKTRSFPLGGI